MKKKIDVDFFTKVAMVNNPLYSVDGKHIAFVRQTPDLEKNAYPGDLYVSTDGKVKKLTGRGDATAYCWTPQNTLLFPAKREPEQKAAESRGQLITPYYEIGLDGGEAQLAFTLPMKARGLTWLCGDLYMFLAEYDRDGAMSPENRLKLQKRREVYEVFDEMPFWKKNQGYENGIRSRLYLYNRDSGLIFPISDLDEEVTHVSHDRHKIIYSAAGYTDYAGVRDEDVSIWTYDALTGAQEKVMEKDALMLRCCEVYGVFWGDKIAVFGSKGEEYGRTETPKVWLIDPKTKQMELFYTYKYNIDYRSIMTDVKLKGNGQRLKVANGKLYFLTTVGFNTYIRTLDREGNMSDFLTPAGSVTGFDVVGEKMCYCGSFGDQCPEIYENEHRQITHFNDHLLEQYSVVTPVYHPFTNKEGIEIDGWFMPPVGYEKGKKYPAILHIHGGPRSTFGDIFFHEHQVWANNGYFVFFCNPRGTDGYGDAFAAVWGHYGSFDYTDLMEFTDEMLRVNPDVDPDRVGVTGGSYAGFMTNWIIGHTDRFAAAVSQRSISNLHTFEHTTAIGYFFTPNNHHARTRENPEKLWDHSPLKYAHNCKTPTLFLHSNEDYVCGLPEGIQMFTAVKMAGVETKLCMFKGEGHELSREGRPRSRVARLTEMLNWWEGHLK